MITSIPKRIVVCCDGTWVASDKGSDKLPTNVTLMSRTIAKEGTNSKGEKVPQIVFYQAGVGTGSLSALEQSLQGAFGSTLNDNVCEAYNFLANNWAPGDEIFLFGFSRGAYTARAIAGLVRNAGLLEPRYMDAFHDMYTAFQANTDGTPFRKTKWAQENWKLYSDYFQKDVKIKAIGVWDTVGSLGLPETGLVAYFNWNKAYRFHNTMLDEGIEHAFHALALDERRYTFSPTMWYLPQASSQGSKTNLTQCWFPGYHSDVGGTASREKAEAEIDEIAFAWMCDQVGRYLTFDHEALNKYFYSKIQKNAWGSGTLTDSMTFSYRLPGSGGAAVRTPKQYKLEGETNECVHPSVYHRIKTRSDYDPPALHGWKHEEGEKGIGFRWVKRAKDGAIVLELPEYKIPKQALKDSVEPLDRSLAPAAHIKTLDAAWGI